MPDGFGGAPLDGVAVAQRRGWVSKVGSFLFGTRNRLLIVWVIAATLMFSGIAAYIIIRRVALVPLADAYAYAAAASCFILLPLLALLLDPSANLASGPRLRLPLVTIGLLATLAVIAVYDQMHLGGALLRISANRVAFFFFLAMPFVLRMWNAANFASYKAENRNSAKQVAKNEALQDALAGRPTIDVNQQIEQHKNAESLSALLGSFFIVAVVLGAWWVGNMPEKDVSLGASLGVGIFLTVVGLFAVVVFLDPIADLPVVRGCATLCNGAARKFAFLAKLYDWIDGALVRIGAHVAGVDHREWYSRYFVLGGTLICLAVLGLFLPAPLGLIPVAMGLVVALSVSRLWSWVEEDRNLASITQFNSLAPKRVGFREDFRDETILGFAFVLILIPIGLMQAHKSDMFGPLFVAVDHGKAIDPNSWLMWLGYFGFELAKALPIVDWADIYNLGPGGDSIRPVHPYGQHAVFMARAMVDLILIAALLQAIGIANRNRQQKMLYATGQIDRLDELVEKVELKKAIAASQNGEANFDLNKPSQLGLIDFVPYNEKRLREIYATSGESSRARAFITAIFVKNNVSPEPAIVTLETLAEQHRNELELVRTFDQAKQDHQSTFRLIDIDEIKTIMLHLRNEQGMEAFKNELLKMGASLGTPNKKLDLFKSVSLGVDRDRFLYTRAPTAREIIKIAPHVTSADEIAECLSLIDLYRDQIFGAQKQLARDVENALTEQFRALGGGPKPSKMPDGADESESSG